MTQEALSAALRWIGALALLVVGGVHLQEYQDGYSGIPTIGPLFLLNFVGAAALAVALLLPLERLLGRHGSLLAVLAALGAVLLAAMSLVMLMIAERRPLFGFVEPGYDPTAITVSRISEVATILLLGGFLVTRFAGDRSRRGGRPAGGAGEPAARSGSRGSRGG